MFKSERFKINEVNGICFLTVPSFTTTGLVKHAFSTRIGGVSRGQYSKMNLSFGNSDCESDVHENFTRIFTAMGSESVQRLVMSRQEHTDIVNIVTSNDARKGITIERNAGAVDGMITCEQNLPLVTLYADCVPLLFLDPVKKVIASTHSGWRGTVQKIGAVTVTKMKTQFGCNPKDIIAAILPCIGACCYEVDQPLYEAFGGGDIFSPAKREGYYMLDLVKANAQILQSVGIISENLTVTDICTNCNADTFHSHRATGGHRGNLAAIIELI